MEAFFVVVMAAVMLAVGVLAMLAVRRVDALAPDDPEDD